MRKMFLSFYALVKEIMYYFLITLLQKERKRGWDVKCEMNKKLKNSRYELDHKKYSFSLMLMCICAHPHQHT